MVIRAGIVGGSGYAGGELLRLLLGHPNVDVVQITSQQYAGRFVHGVHPNLRGVTQLKFCTIDNLEPCDVLFLALPHGSAAQQIDHFAALTGRIIDLSADFRLRDPSLYETWYGQPHANPDWLSKFVYGLPEIFREQLRDAHYVSGVGCNATAVNLALFPLALKGLIEQVIVEVKVGSSEAGNSPGLAGHHPERSGAMRSFAPTGHRHQAEVTQALSANGSAQGAFELHFSATAVEMVRGVLSTAHVFLKEDLDEKDVWALYREVYGQEPFIRLVKDRRGVYRYPEPKILSGSNYCDIGFAKDPQSKRLVLISAIDNLMKGAAGTAVQALNVMMGWQETTGLAFTGLHPI